MLSLIIDRRPFPQSLARPPKSKGGCLSEALAGSQLLSQSKHADTQKKIQSDWKEMRGGEVTCVRTATKQQTLKKKFVFQSAMTVRDHDRWRS